MSLDDMVRDTVTEWAEEAGTPEYAIGLADAVLSGYATRRRRRRAATVLVAAGVAAAVAVPLALAGGGSRQTVGHPSPEPSLIGRTSTKNPPHQQGTLAGWTPLPLSHAHAGNTSISAHPGESPPVHFIAADDVALSAYYRKDERTSTTKYTWWLYDPNSGTYQPTPYQQLDVSPGLGLAAVLEDATGSKRIGILNMATRKVIRWIAVPDGDPVGSVRFSPDGTKLVATAFDGDAASIRTASIRAIIVVDLVAGTINIQPLDPPPHKGGVNLGAEWTSDGRYVFLYSAAYPLGLFFSPAGYPVPAPPDAHVLTSGYTNAGRSPDGTMYVVAVPPPSGGGPLTGVSSVATGQLVATQPMLSLSAWANDGALVGYDCGQSCVNDLYARLALTSLDGRTITPLSAPQAMLDNLTAASPWVPLFTRR